MTQMSFHQYRFQPSEFNHETWSLPIHLPYSFQFSDLMKALSKFDTVRLNTISASDRKKITDTLKKYFIRAKLEDERTAWKTILFAATDYSLEDKKNAFYIPDVDRRYTVEDVVLAVRKLIRIVSYLERADAQTGLKDIRKSLFVAQDVLDNYSRRSSKQNSKLM